ncbi:MAG: FHA domain-containing protein [Anaerolineae bacterium]|nr:FHA domain-containing protein [Anaerolineae bacterium]
MQISNRCPYCGHQNRSGVLYCDDCGHSLVDKSSETLSGPDLNETTSPLILPSRGNLFDADIHRQSDPFPPNGALVIHVRDADEPIALIPGERTTFGRYDSRNPHHVDVDLTPYGAFKMGVSRIHATIHRESDRLTLVDGGSANGTFLNGFGLIPHTPIPLCNGDEIRMGNLIMHIYFNQ